MIASCFEDDIIVNPEKMLVWLDRLSKKSYPHTSDERVVYVEQGRDKNLASFINDVVDHIEAKNPPDRCSTASILAKFVCDKLGGPTTQPCTN